MSSERTAWLLEEECNATRTSARLRLHSCTQAARAFLKHPEMTYAYAQMNWFPIFDIEV